MTHEPAHAEGNPCWRMCDQAHACCVSVQLRHGHLRCDSPNFLRFGNSAGEAPARQCLVTRGLLPLLAEGSARATDSDTTDEILHAAIEYSKVGGGDELCCHQARSTGSCQLV
jgi:hypothetical protein